MGGMGGSQNQGGQVLSGVRQQEMVETIVT